MVKMILIIPLVVVTVFIFSAELSSRMVYGRYLPDSETLPYLEKNENQYMANGTSQGLIHGFRIPYIGAMALDPFSKWHIHGIGRIPRWSKAHKVVEGLYRKTYKESAKPSLADYL
jgi:hypothetical protein